MGTFEETKKHIQSLLLSKTDGLLVEDFESEYLKFTGDCFPHRHFGCAVATDLLKRFRDVLHVTQVPSGLTYLHPAEISVRLPCSRTSKTSEEGDKVTITSVSEEVKIKLRDIVSKYPEGMPASQLRGEYRKHFGCELDLYGCQSVVELCALISDVFTVEREGSGDWILHSAGKIVRKSENFNRPVDSGFEQPKNKSNSRYASLETDPTKAKQRCSQDSDIFETSLRTNSNANGQIPRLRSIEVDGNYRAVLGPGDEIPSQQLPENLKCGDFIDVLLAEIFNPNRFCFQLLGLNTSEKSESLLEDMDRFYGASSEHYKIPQSDVVVGLLCVCLYEKNLNWWPYYRCRVTAYVDLTTVEVCFIDYGNVIKVKKDSLLYLSRKFAKLPCQAIKARLAGIKPPGERRSYPKESSVRFTSLSRVTPDGVFVAEVRAMGERLSLWLVDTVSNDLPQGIVVNQVLVDEGLAVPDTGEMRKKSIVDHVTPLRMPMFGEATTARTEKVIKRIKDLHVGSEKSQREQVDGDMDRVVTLEEVKLDGHICHVISQQGSVWMASQQISAFIPRWKGKDLLTKMLSLKHVLIPSLIVTATTDRSMYTRWKTILRDENCSEIVAYSLESIAYILDTFLQIPRVRLREDLQNLIDKVEPTLCENTKVIVDT